MTIPVKKTRTRIKPRGVLDRNRLYTTSACNRELGFGSTILFQARRAGVKPIMVGSTRFYSGDELADWLMDLRKRQKTN